MFLNAKKLLMKNFTIVFLLIFLLYLLTSNVKLSLASNIDFNEISKVNFLNIQDNKEFNLESFTLPAFMGKVKDQFNAGNNSDIIIHIQDAHCNYACQMRICEIINYLTKNYNIETINLEGGNKGYDISNFTRIKDKQMRHSISDYFVKEGLLSGAEFFAINNPDKVNLWGLEDVDLYLSNLSAYRNSLKYMNEVNIHLKVLKHILNNLKTHIYSTKMLDFDLKYTGYKTGNIGFKDFLLWLVASADEKDININAFKNVFLFNKTINLESSVDFKKANVERDKIVDFLKKALSKNEKKRLVINLKDYKQNIITRKDFYSYLSRCARIVGIDMKLYPEFNKYIDYISTYEKLDKLKIMQEIEALGNILREELCTTPEEKELALLSKHLSMLQNLFGLKLTTFDYMYYLDNKDTFNVDNFTSFINQQCPQYAITTRPDNSIKDLDRYREEITDFYKYSFDRDSAFLRNMKTPKVSIMITGGFHTDNLSMLLRKKGVSYISIIPKFKNCNGYISPYFEILSGDPGTIEKKLEPLVLKAFALQIASVLSVNLAQKVWNWTDIYAYKGALALYELISKGNKIVFTTNDGTPLTDSKGVPLTFGTGDKKVILTVEQFTNLLEKNKTLAYLERWMGKGADNQERIQAMKLPGVQDPTVAVKPLKKKIKEDPEFRSSLKSKIISSKKILEMYTDKNGQVKKAVVIYEDLGAEAGAALIFDEIKYKGMSVIMLNTNGLYCGEKGAVLFEKEALYHEKREDYWNSLGFDTKTSHILASVEQTLKYKVTKDGIIGLTPYHQHILNFYKQNNPERLKSLDLEYRNLASRTYINTLIAHAMEIGDIDLEEMTDKSLENVVAFRESYEKEFNIQITEALKNISPEDMTPQDLGAKIRKNKNLQKAIGEVISYGIKTACESGFGIINKYEPGEIKKGGSFSMPCISQNIHGLIHYHPLERSPYGGKYIHLLSYEDFMTTSISNKSSSVAIWGTQKTGFWATEVIGHYFKDYMDTAYYKKDATSMLPDGPKDIMPSELIAQMPKGSIKFYKLVPNDDASGYLMKNALLDKVDKAVINMRKNYENVIKDIQDKEKIELIYQKWKNLQPSEINDALRRQKAGLTKIAMQKALGYAKEKETISGIIDKLTGKDPGLFNILNNLISILKNEYNFEGFPFDMKINESSILKLDINQLSDALKRKDITQKIRSAGFDLEIKTLPFKGDHLNIFISKDLPTQWLGTTNILSINSKDLENKVRKLKEQGSEINTNEISLNAIVIRELADRYTFMKTAAQYTRNHNIDVNAILNWVISEKEKSRINKAINTAKKSGVQEENSFLNDIILKTENTLRTMAAKDLQGKKLSILRDEQGQLIGFRGRRMVVFEDIKAQNGLVVKYLKESVTNISAEQLKNTFLAVSKRLGSLFAPVIIEDLVVEIEKSPGKFIKKKIKFAIVQEKVQTVDHILDKFKKERTLVHSKILEIKKELGGISSVKKMFKKVKKRKKALENELDKQQKRLTAIEKKIHDIVLDMRKLTNEMAKLGIKDQDIAQWQNNYGYSIPTKKKAAKLLGFDADNYIDIENGKMIWDMNKTELDKFNSKTKSKWPSVPNIYINPLSNEISVLVSKYLETKTDQFVIPAVTPDDQLSVKPVSVELKDKRNVVKDIKRDQSKDKIIQKSIEPEDKNIDITMKKTDKKEDRLETTMKTLSDMNIPADIVRTIVVRNVSLDPGEYEIKKKYDEVNRNVNNGLKKNGYNLENDSDIFGDKKQLIFVDINMKKSTPDQIKSAITDAVNQIMNEDKRLSARKQNRAHYVVYSPEFGSIKISNALKNNYKKEKRVTIVPDSYNDDSLKEGYYPDYMFRIGLARRIAYLTVTNGKNLDPINNLLLQVAEGKGQVKVSIQNGKIIFNGVLKIKPVDWNDISDWQESMEAIATSL